MVTEQNPTLLVEKLKANINGHSLSFKRSGNGFPLILIHTHHPYAKYFLESLPKNNSASVFTVNIPGYYSEGQKKPVDTIDKFINLLNKLLEQQNLSQVDLLGECLGSVIVLKFAAKYPQKVRRLVAVSLPLRAFDPKIKKTVGPIFTFLRKYRLAGGLAKLLIRLNLWRGITNYFGGYQEFWSLFKRETLLVGKWNFDPRVFWGILSDLFQADIKRVIGEIKAETLLVIGDKDRITKKKEILKFCQVKKNFSYAIVPGANHALIVTHTKKFNQIVTNFLFPPNSL